MVFYISQTRCVHRDLDFFNIVIVWQPTCQENKMQNNPRPGRRPFRCDSSGQVLRSMAKTCECAEGGKGQPSWKGCWSFTTMVVYMNGCPVDRCKMNRRGERRAAKCIIVMYCCGRRPNFKRPSYIPTSPARFMPPLSHQVSDTASTRHDARAY